MRTLLQTTLAAVMMVSLATSAVNAENIQQVNHIEPGTGIAFVTPCNSVCDAPCAPTCEVPCAPVCEVPCAPTCEVPCAPTCEVPCAPTCEAPACDCCASSCMDACCYEAVNCCGKRGCCFSGIHKHYSRRRICVITTGDMHPHYAYQPEHHGYYYFRPYNYISVLEHKQRVVAIGGDFKSPYSLAMFDGIYADFKATVEPLPEQPSPIVEDDEALPLLDALLNQ